MTVSVIEQAKIQAQVLVPLVKALQAELGNAASSTFRTYARDDVLAYDVIEQNHDAFAFDVTRCAYAEFYKAPGEPELGFLLICTADFATAEGFGADVSLTRTQTIMQGADHCDFRYGRDRGGAQ